jgi:hypothetical protein
MLTFKLKEHGITKGRQVVELWENGELLGCLYPQVRGFDIESKFILATGLDCQDKMKTFVYIRRMEVCAT